MEQLNPFEKMLNRNCRFWEILQKLQTEPTRLKFLKHGKNSDWASSQMDLTVPQLQISIIPWNMPNYFSFVTLKRENKAKFISLKISAFDKKSIQWKKRETRSPTLIWGG